MRPNQHQRGRTSPNQQQRGLLTGGVAGRRGLERKTGSETGLLPPKMRPNQQQRGRTSPNKHQRGRMTVSKISRVGNRLMIVYHCDLRCFSMNVEQNNCVQCCMNLIFTVMTPSPLSHRFISYVWHKCNQAILRKLMVPTRQRRGRLE